MTWNVDLRKDVDVVINLVANAVGIVTETDDRTELDVGLRQRIHQVEQCGVLLLQRAGGVVPDECEVRRLVHHELIEQADRSGGTSKASGAQIQHGPKWRADRKHVRIPRIGDVVDRSKWKIGIGRLASGVEVFEDRDTGERLEKVQRDNFRARGEPRETTPTQSTVVPSPKILAASSCI